MDHEAQPIQVMGLSFPTEAEHVVVALGRCREHIICAAATAVVHSTQRGGVSDGITEQFFSSVKGYGTELKRALTPEIETKFQKDCSKSINIIKEFASQLKVIENGFISLDRDAATLLLQNAQEQALPALAHLTDCVLARAAKDQNEALSAIKDRNETLEDVLGKMQSVGRAINMISINAAIEASRTGGASGRTFGVISTEIRSLASQATALLDRARNSVNENEAAN